MQSEIKSAIMLCVAIAVGIGVISFLLSSHDGMLLNDSDMIIDKSHFKMAPDIVGISNYLNVSPQELNEKIKGNVVLYDIWTYSCINCIRTLPYITAWNEKYADQGLLIVGIHSPEFEFEKNVQNVKTAIAKYNIEYPVVMDNDMETWKAFENQYWPRKYLADHEGYIRYDHIGEGAYQETEQEIQKLLNERALAMGVSPMGSNVTTVDIDPFKHDFKTPELYFGYKFAQFRNHLSSPEGFQPESAVEYSMPENDIVGDRFYLNGEWFNHEGSMELLSNVGTVTLSYTAKQVNIVTEGMAELVVTLDGQPIPSDIAGSDVNVETSTIMVSDPGLYNIIDGQVSESHVMQIMVLDKEFQIFTFTFG